MLFCLRRELCASCNSARISIIVFPLFKEGGYILHKFNILSFKSRMSFGAKCLFILLYAFSNSTFIFKWLML